MLDPVANIKSQIKRNRTNEKRRLRNKAAKSEVKTRIKAALRAAEAGEEKAPELLRVAVKRLDKAAQRGIIHRNQAANRKSALMAKAARLAASSLAAHESPEEPEPDLEVAEAAGGTTSAEAGAGVATRLRRRVGGTRPKRGRRGHEASGGVEAPDGEGEGEAGAPELTATKEDEASAAGQTRADEAGAGEQTQG